MAALSTFAATATAQSAGALGAWRIPTSAAGRGLSQLFEVTRAIGPAGKLKVDWIFVKPPALTDPYDRKQPYWFAPHFGRTLKSLNYGVAHRVSDHDPMLVDLPLGNPDIP